MKQYYVYIITNLVNGKQYIGQHYGELDDSYLGSGTLIKKAIAKYGKDNFRKDILQIYDSYDSLNQGEEYWIAYYNAVKDEHFYNIATGGANSNPLAGMTAEAKAELLRKHSEANKGEKNYFYGKHLRGEEHPFWGRHHSEESKQKMREAKVGGKAPTAKGVSIYDLEGNFIRSFETQRDFKVFVGLSPNGSTDTLKKYINAGKPYHGYIVKYS